MSNSNSWRQEITNSSSFNSDSWDKYHRNNKFRDYGNKINYHFQNKKKKFSKLYSAGILPYSFDDSGNTVVLLGKDTDGNWSDFGGRCEICDNSDPRVTASREFYEETLGSVTDIAEMTSRISRGNPLKIISKTLNGSPYYMYVIHTPYENYEESFNKTFRFLKYINTSDRVIEKTQIRWVTLNTMLSVLDNSPQNAMLPLRSIFNETLKICREELVYLSNR